VKVLFSLKAPTVLAVILFLGFAAAAQTTNGVSSAEIQGQQLAAELLSETPVTNFTQTGILKIHNSAGTTNIPISFATSVQADIWRVVYETRVPGAIEGLMIAHKGTEPNQYFSRLRPRTFGTGGITGINSWESLSQSQIMAPFANSDFWIADLGLEFFHWPEQKVTGHEIRRTRDCTVLESDNPNPSAGGYSRVVTWIDKDTLGIIYAEAYDVNNKKLKIFDPKKVKKVNGQWQLENIEIQNVQTHSRTWIRFNLNGES
jgi:hypothetical protein